MSGHSFSAYCASYSAIRLGATISAKNSSGAETPSKTNVCHSYPIALCLWCGLTFLRLTVTSNEGKVSLHTEKPFKSNCNGLAKARAR